MREEPEEGGEGSSSPVVGEGDMEKDRDRIDTLVLSRACRRQNLLPGIREESG